MLTVAEGVADVGGGGHLSYLLLLNLHNGRILPDVITIIVRIWQNT